MKKIKLVALFSLSTLMLMNITNVAAKPEDCPKASDILNTVTVEKPQSIFQDGATYHAVWWGNFGMTPVNVWSFHITNIDATSNQDAMNKTYRAIPSLTDNPNESMRAENYAWVCTYDISNGYRAFATQLEM